MALETLVYSPLSYSTRLLAREHFIQFSRLESFKLYKNYKDADGMGIVSNDNFDWR
jgi:hypothetical protein